MSQRDFFAEIVTEAKPRPMAGILYAPEGCGKTSLGAAIPGAIFAVDDKERGIDTLKVNGLVDSSIPVLPAFSDWGDVLAALRQLPERKEYKALVIDTLGGFERLCHEHVCRVEYGGSWDKFASYARGYDASTGPWRDFINLLDGVRDSGKAVLCLAHAQVKPFKNPEGDDYDRFTPDLHHKTWSLTHKWADLVVFMNYYTEVSRDGLKPKGKGGQQRFMYTERHAAYDAKNRASLPGEIPCGNSGEEAWGNLKAALVAAKKGAK